MDVQEVKFNVDFVPDTSAVEHVEVSSWIKGSQRGSCTICSSPTVAWLIGLWTVLMSVAILGGIFVSVGYFFSVGGLVAVGVGCVGGVRSEDQIWISPLGRLFLSRRINRAKRNLLKELLDAANRGKKHRELIDFVESHEETVKVDWENRRAF